MIGKITSLFYILILISDLRPPSPISRLIAILGREWGTSQKFLTRFSCPFAKTVQGLEKVSQIFSLLRYRKLKNPLSARLDLNQGPPRYKLGALPTELQADKIFFNFIHHFVSELKYFRACLFDSCCKFGALYQLTCLPAGLRTGRNFKTIAQSSSEDK